MRQVRKSGSLVAALMLGLAMVGGMEAVQPAHAARTAAMVNVENEQLPIATSAKQVEAAVLQSLSNRGWTVLKRSAGRIEAQYARSDFSANIAVAYTGSTFSITYLDSTGLSYDAAKNKIHTNYNKWISNLKNDIIRMVTNAANGVPGAQ